MGFSIKAVSPLVKIRSADRVVSPALQRISAIRGERVSFQLVIRSDANTAPAKVRVESSLSESVHLYLEKEVYVDRVATQDITEDEYLIKEPGFLPDVLIPLGEQNDTVFITKANAVIWVRVDIPEDADVGEHEISLHVDVTKVGNIQNPVTETLSAVVSLKVLPAQKPPQKLIYTRWLYADCVADYHHVDVYSEQHWALLDAYIARAAEVGVNMMLVPIHTPPLDTEVGTARTCVQLIDIEKKDDKYTFSFDKFRRFIKICKKNHIQYFEMAHLFSQWGAAYAPNIQITENGKTSYRFGWHVSADDPEYMNFLGQYLAAISAELKREGIEKNTYFHVSDEPRTENMEKYRAARDMIRAHIGDSKLFDALSHVEFYEEGLVNCPVTIISEIHRFLPYHIEDQWVYYCCVPETIYPNSFLAMPLSRVRILGYLIYKYNIKGFLHWGLNFYNAQVSRYRINPYLTTSADGVFPSGDTHILYPSSDGAYGSIRGEVTYQAIQDVDLCTCLEKHIGRDAVVDMIDRAAGKPITFSEYPTSEAFFETVRESMMQELEKHT